MAITSNQSGSTPEAPIFLDHGHATDAVAKFAVAMELEPPLEDFEAVAIAGLVIGAEPSTDIHERDVRYVAQHAHRFEHPDSRSLQLRELYIGVNTFFDRAEAKRYTSEQEAAAKRAQLDRLKGIQHRVHPMIRDTVDRILSQADPA